MAADPIDYTAAFAAILNARNPIGALRALVEQEREAERDRIVRWLRNDAVNTRAYAETNECGPNRRPMTSRRASTSTRKAPMAASEKDQEEAYKVMGIVDRVNMTCGQIDLHERIAEALAAAREEERAGVVADLCARAESWRAVEAAWLAADTKDSVESERCSARARELEVIADVYGRGAGGEALTRLLAEAEARGMQRAEEAIMSIRTSNVAAEDAVIRARNAVRALRTTTPAPTAGKEGK